MTVPPRIDTPPAPTLIGRRYAVERELGRGASAFVYLARDAAQDRRVAVKVLRPELAQSLDAARFLREIRTTAKLQHPRIVSVLDQGAEGDQFYWVAPYLDGGSLRDRLTRERQLPIRTAVAIAHAIAVALDFAHTHGVIHRDVKPENILFVGDEACLGDFGIARALDDAPGWTTTTGLVRGTPAYMSPEQASGERELDGRSDVYALGCVLYEMLAGVPPFSAATAQATIAQRFTHPPESLTRHRATVSPELEEIVRLALATAPADRFGTARAFAEALAGTGLLHATGTGEVPPSPRRPRPDRRERARRVALGVAGVAGVAAAAAVAALGWWALGARDDAAPPGTLLVRVASATDGPRDAALTERVARALRAELEGWSEVRVSDRARRPALVLTASAVRLGDSARVIVDAVDGSAGTSRRLVEIASATAVDAAPTVTRLVRRALAGPDVVDAPDAETMPGRSLGALRSYVRGWEQLRSGQLDSAAESFMASARANPRFALASLWAAQAGAWRDPRDPRPWLPFTATARAGSLTGRDSTLAVALGAMAAKDYPSACAAFRATTVRDPSSFAGWFGLGECARLDTTVLRTPEGARFRSSTWASLAAFREAVERAPSSALLGALFERILRSTSAAGNVPRRGWLAGDGGGPYVALPSLDADTLAFFPVSLDESLRAGARAVPRTYTAATRRGREVLLDLTERWTQRAPESSQAWFRRALALELAGQIGDGAAEQSAPAALEKAAAGARSEEERARIAVARTRLALRRGDFAGAARIARTALADGPSQPGEARDTLLPLAALVGDVARAERWSVPAAPDPALPQPVADSLQLFQVRAVLGACDGMDESRRRLERAVSISFAPAEVARQRARVLQPAYRDAVPCLGPGILTEFTPTAPVDAAYLALARHDPSAARHVLAAARERRAGADITSITWDFLFAESWALVQAGDTTDARQQLLDAMNSLASMNAYTLSRLSQAAGLRRSLDLLQSITARDAAGRLWQERRRALSTTQSPSR